ncbi:MAG: hypothetical protein O7G86_02975, partial [Gammaproteobacteria bacterium]|nr:hypothetical protein [Gammaproteobacteria bacterium]
VVFEHLSDEIGVIDVHVAVDNTNANILATTDVMQTLNLETMITVLKFEQRIVVRLTEHSLEFVHSLGTSHPPIRLQGLDQRFDLAIVRYGEHDTKQIERLDWPRIFAGEFVRFFDVAHGLAYMKRNGPQVTIVIGPFRTAKPDIGKISRLEGYEQLLSRCSRRSLRRRLASRAKDDQQRKKKVPVHYSSSSTQRNTGF